MGRFGTDSECTSGDPGNPIVGYALALVAIIVGIIWEVVRS